MAAEEGKKAPAFTLPGDDGEKHRLKDHEGKRVVVYFYPKDNTPGCTTQACDFRDNMERITKSGAIVYGISKDSLASHDKFRDKFDLNFVLLSDEKLVEALKDRGIEIARRTVAKYRGQLDIPSARLRKEF